MHNSIISGSRIALQKYYSGQVVDKTGFILALVHNGGNYKWVWMQLSDIFEHTDSLVPSGTVV